MGLFGSGRDELYRGDAPVSLPGPGGGAPRPYRGVDRGGDGPDMAGLGAPHATNRVGVNQGLSQREPTGGYAPPGVVETAQGGRGTGVVVVFLLMVGLGVSWGWIQNAVTSDEGAKTIAEADAGATGLALPDIADMLADLTGGAAVPPGDGADAGGNAADAGPANAGNAGGPADRAGDPADPAGDPADNPDSDTAADLSDRLIIDFRGARLAFTVYVGTLHPHGMWRYASATSPATLTVRIVIERLDSGADPLELTAWNWVVETPEDGRVNAKAYEFVEPSLGEILLSGGETADGYLTFPVTTPQATLRLTEGIAGEDVAYWDFTAYAPQVIDAAFGDAVAGDIGQPPFTVAVTGAATAAGDGADFLWPATTGRYLRIGVSIAALDGLTGPAGLVGNGNFAYVTADGTELPPIYGVTDDTLTIQTITPGLMYDASLIFDTPDTTGTLELRDPAGQTVIRWPLGGAT